MMDVMKNWLDHWTSKNEIKRTYGEDPLPNRPNSSKKMYDSQKLNRHLERIDRMFETEKPKHEDFMEKTDSQEMLASE